MKKRRRRRISNFRTALLCAVTLIVFLSIVVGNFLWQSGRTQARGVEQNSVGMRARVEYGGKTHAEKTALTTILLMGIDKTSDDNAYGARMGGQADFQLLLVIDHNDKIIRQLQIDRDTITDVEILGVLGNSLGTQPMQICLAHGYGTSDTDCAERAVRAVEGLLPGLEVDLYLALDMSAIRTLNDLLGGITVTLEDDFTAYDPAMTPGTTLTLTGDQAEIFVRQRMEVGDGSNQARMLRQRSYIRAAMEIVKSRSQENAGYIAELFDALADDMTTNIQRTRLLNEANRSCRYELLPIEDLAGEHSIGADGFVEFHVEDGATLNWVMQALYEPIA